MNVAKFKSLTIAATWGRRRNKLADGAREAIVTESTKPKYQAHRNQDFGTHHNLLMAKGSNGTDQQHKA